jgi:hypothetical protein
MARPDPFAGRARPDGLGRYLLDGERIVTAVHQHWAKVAEPVASLVAGLVLVLVLDSYLPAGLGLMADLLWWAWFVLVGRGVWKVLERQHDWFVATDKRLILTYGLITQRVAMMPLTKVTDMSYNRSPLGRLLGYGTFVMESAGQDQALHRVGWVANPDHTYRAICAEIFGVDDHERVQGPDEHDHRFGGGPTDRPETTGFSTAIRIRPPGSHPSESDPGETDIYKRESDSEVDSHEADRDASIREADTGPIPNWRPELD